jgi:hypothetical protein
MDLGELRRHLDALAESLRVEDRRLLAARLEGLISVFPFNEYEYILTFLLDRQRISFAEYDSLRTKYVSTNRYLDLYGLSPRVFGQVWGEEHLMDLDGRLRKPDRSLDPNYSGEYDLWLEGVRVEAKASRAVNKEKTGNLATKALPYGVEEPFWMNFQQLKLDVCDVFVFIGVWVDTIVYWVMSNEEVKASRYLSHQHRGGIEYQIGITDKNLSDFAAHQCEPASLATVVIGKGR